MNNIIHLLPDHVANQIAAGEVVQRPASVIKELLENSIDAGADQIKIAVKDAGKTLIQVTDNGKGMGSEDANLCFKRHATSKIRTADDLFQLTTKGFRGEALASIAAIAHVELKTSVQGQEVGTYVRMEGGSLTANEACVTAVGTSISVKNLFFNIPARRNFLKSDAVELRHMIDEFHRIALAHPDVQFSFQNNNDELFQLPKSNIRQRIVNILGGKTNEKLVPVKEDTEIVKIKGFVGKPQFAKRGRGEQFFFVNGRFIKSPYLHHSVMAAFEGLLKEKTNPSYFLYLEVNPKSIDINIHPTKTEIKFDDEHALYTILRSAIKHSLGQFSVAPVLDFDRDATLDTPYDYTGKPAVPPRVEVDPNFNPFREDRKSHHKSNGSWEGLYTDEGEERGLQDYEFESEEVTGSLFAENSDDIPGSTTFQLNKKYIVTTLRSGMIIIDQNRAHTRILYEELLSSITMNPAVSQHLLFPLHLELSSEEIRHLTELREALEFAGFVFSEVSKDSVAISGIPMAVSASEVPILLEQLFHDLEHELPDTSFSQVDVLSKSLAKGMAVKSGTPLSPEEQQNLVNSLFACKETRLSPYNKTIFITLANEDLDKKFM